MFSSSLLKFTLCSSILLLSSVSIFIIIALNSFLGRLLISTSLSSFSDIMSCSFVWNTLLCLLILPNSLCFFLVLGRLVTFPNLGEVALCRRHPLGPSNMLPLFIRAICSRGAPYVGWVYPPVAGPTIEGALVGRAGSLAWLAVSHALCSGCRPIGGQNTFPAQLTVTWGAAASLLEDRAGSPHGCLHGPLMKPQVLNTISLLAY